MDHISNESRKIKYRSIWARKIPLQLLWYLLTTSHAPNQRKNLFKNIFWLLFYYIMCFVHQKELSVELNKNYVSLLNTNMLTGQEGSPHEHWDDGTMVWMLMSMAKLDPKERIKAVVRPTQVGQISLESLPSTSKGPSSGPNTSCKWSSLHFFPVRRIMPICLSLSFFFLPSLSSLIFKV